MLRNVDITKRGRRTGKTFELQKILLDNIIKGEYEKVYIINPTRNMSEIWERYLKEIGIFNCGFIRLISEVYQIPVGHSNQEILVLIDEYDMMDEQKQAKFIDALDLKRSIFDIIGRGTLIQRQPRLFKDFINE